MKKKKIPTSIRLTSTAARLLDVLSSKLGVTKSAVLEFAIRSLAQQHGVTVEDEGVEE